jgi:tRNA nucleotidyltransferase (CCA-adding enzyme)
MLRHTPRDPLCYPAGMKIYLVGGAVRDELLHLPVTERDWVVVGATPEDMLALGYTPVGKDFPVFLHPDTKEEYALARTERKTAPGYKGFVFHADADVSLEEDLRRRDLTINAMARDDDGQLIDPFNGRADLDNGLLKHVSPAFAEDPVRILRIARFAARFAEYGFKVAHDTNKLMRTMVQTGEVDHLVPERVWAELEKALQESRPAQFFKVLRGCGALAKLFAAIDNLYEQEGLPEHGQSIEIHAMQALQQAAELTHDPLVRFATLAMQMNSDAVIEIANRYRLPNDYRELGAMAADFGHAIHEADTLDAEMIMDLLEATDALRRPERLQQLLLACEADARARGEQKSYESGRILNQALESAMAVNAKDLTERGLSGAELGEALRLQRVTAIARALG